MIVKKVVAFHLDCFIVFFEVVFANRTTQLFDNFFICFGELFGWESVDDMLGRCNPVVSHEKTDSEFRKIESFECKSCVRFDCGSLEG